MGVGGGVVCNVVELRGVGERLHSKEYTQVQKIRLWSTNCLKVILQLLRPFLTLFPASQIKINDYQIIL